MTMAWPRTAQSSCRATAVRSSWKRISSEVRFAQKTQERFMRWFVVIMSLALPVATAQQLEKGVGAVHYPVYTRNAEAQKFFDQGMSYLYGFNHEAAIRSFKRATEL